MSFYAKRLLPKSRNTFLNLPSLMSRISVKKIADSWPASIDDAEARNWNWKHEFDLESRTKTC
jgi:hypothetical protein